MVTILIKQKYTTEVVGSMSEKLYTLEQAKELLKDELRVQLDKGAHCEICAQYVRMYKKRLSSTAVLMMIRLYWLEENTSEPYHHLNDLMRGFSISGCGDFATSRFWGLVKEMPNDDPKKKASGMWSLTENGKKFVNKEVRVKSHAKIYNAKCYGLVGDYIDVKEALKKKFDYEELMLNT